MRQSSPPAPHRLRRLLGAALVVSSVLATVVAVGVVVGVFWWLRPVPSPPAAVSMAPPRVSAAVPAAPLEQPAPPRPAENTRHIPPTAAPPSAPPPAAAVPVAVAPAAEPPEAEPPATPVGSAIRGVDATRNRAIIQEVLRKAAENPAVQRGFEELVQSSEESQRQQDLADGQETLEDGAGADPQEER